MVEKIVYPDWISKKMKVRFDILDFCVDTNGFLYSPKAFNDDWDFQTKAFYYRSIDIGPERIAKKLGLKVTTIKHREFLGLITLDYEGKNYKLRDTSWHDWSDLGTYDNSLRYHEVRGGAIGKPEKETGQNDMDGELNQTLRDYEQPDDPNEPIDPYKEYYGDYKDMRTGDHD